MQTEPEQQPHLLRGDLVDSGFLQAAPLQRLVDDINIKRRAVYFEKARENNATPDAYALAAGCTAIVRTDDPAVPGFATRTFSSSTTTTCPSRRSSPFSPAIRRREWV